MRYISKIRLSPSIFVHGSLEVSYKIVLETQLCGFWFINLTFPLDLCARMLGWLRAKIQKALKLDTKMLGRLEVKIRDASYFHYVWLRT